ncbi:hypothetical protein M501DRAFT_994395 [Patellaria atrata CBS 101060]|uniref:F-box domain-containing protein n=1 Tax=Patellaria atrata CBS 101060 TaxID=1346257 RepID=A0A9P4SJH0_9PEZI|nr:hypothetical protein M501DRAFT_994395 [Patellaria atrata CBS 101060]
MATAVERVFSIVELHEDILLQLPILDLLMAQKVSKQWQSVSNSSIKIKRRLSFTKPDHVKMENWASCRPVQSELLRPFFSIIAHPSGQYIPGIPWTCYHIQLAPGAKLILFKYPKASWRKMWLFQPLVTYYFSYVSGAVNAKIPIEGQPLEKVAWSIEAIDKTEKFLKKDTRHVLEKALRNRLQLLPCADVERRDEEPKPHSEPNMLT